jgi:hypothetical protein
MLLLCSEARVIRIAHLNPPLMLKPGINEIPDATWTKLKADPTIQSKLENGDMEAVTEKGKADSLMSFSPAKAKEIIKDTVDRDLLKKWAEVEKRKPIQMAISDQQKVLSDVHYREEDTSEEIK